MGAYPSCSSVPSCSVSEDIQHLRALFPDKFSVEQNSGSESATLFAHDGKITLILVANADAANARNSVALVVDEFDINKIAKRNEENGKPYRVKKGPKRFVMEEIRLPGGSVLFLVNPTMVSSKRGRQVLVKALTRSATNNGEDEDIASSAEVEDETDTDSSSSNGTAPPLTESPDGRPSFPSLSFQLLQKDDQYEPLPLNSREGIPFETELFHGRILLLLRPPGDPAKEDPYWNEKIFSKKNRRVIIQVQGKFKQKPQGVVYAGGEITEPMKLGLVAKGLCKALLKLLKSFYDSIYYSFGDDEEPAQIVFPAYMFFERFIATKPGDTPPPMGEFFEESAESIRKRKSGKSLGEWNTEDTYSFSFYSMYLDLPTWSLCNLPFSNNISLRTFWGKSSLRICLYDRLAPKEEKKHKPEYNNYGLVVQAKYLGSNPKRQPRKSAEKSKSHNTSGNEISSENGTENASDDTSSMGEGNILDWTEADSRGNSNLPTMTKSDSQAFIVDNSDEEPLDMNQFFDAQEYTEETEDKSKQEACIATTHPIDMQKTVDNVCPAWIEMLVHRGNYGRAYAVNVTSNDETHTVFRRADSVLDLFDDPKEIPGSPRMSSAERTRRRIGELLLENATATNFDEKIESLSTEYDDKFLNRKTPSMTKRRSSRTLKACFAARALSDRHWIEEWVVVTRQNITFLHPDRMKPNHRIGVQQIVRVQELEASEAPFFPRHFFLSIETLGRTNYIMFASKQLRDEWLEILSEVAKTLPSSVDADESSLASSSNAAMELENPKHEFLHKSSLWDYKHRRVLNCRRFSFRRGSDQSLEHDPLSFAEIAVRKALDPRNETDDDTLISFLDAAALLKDANIYDLSEIKRMAFFLNLYHCMVMHAYLVLGPPETSFQWISYFNSISYQCSDDIFSLAELEHCIIRSQMASPTQFLSRFVIPKSKYDFALTTSEHRINFALNCGSKSNPSCVPVFKVAQLDQQLEEASKLYFAGTVKVKKRSSHEIEVFLPRVTLWFSDDFGSTKEEVLGQVKRFFSRDIQDHLTSFQETNKGKCSVKYLPYSFECRKLTLTPENNMSEGDTTSRINNQPRRQ